MTTQLATDWLHKEFPKTCGETDFWRQVKRTVRGNPVGEEQIQQIEDAIKAHLKLAHKDYLLDLCCGNGALSSRIFMHCEGGVGVDFSDYLIQIARKYFASSRQTYLVEDVVDFCEQASDTSRYTKASCYGAFCYLSPSRAERMLAALRCRFENLQRIFLGNLADRNKAELFYTDHAMAPRVLDDPHSPLGYWWGESKLVELAERCGWRAEVTRMPNGFYGSHYRFDATLSVDSRAARACE